eukprot:SAG31_NODE_263_length_18841_cov_17.270996_2_plen_131_part_00
MFSALTFTRTLDCSGCTLHARFFFASLLCPKPSFCRFLVAVATFFGFAFFLRACGFVLFVFVVEFCAFFFVAELGVATRSRSADSGSSFIKSGKLAMNSTECAQPVAKGDWSVSRLSTWSERKRLFDPGG